MTTGSADAGWYADPAGSSYERYWDGTTWSDHLRPPGAPPPGGGWSGASGSWASVVRPQPASAGPCPTCGRDWGSGISCQFCGQVGGLPPGVVLSGAGRRLGGYLLEGVLVLVTAWIGWIVWSAIIWSRGQTPAKQVLGMRVVKLRTGRQSTWGTMFLRETIGRFIGWVVNLFTLGIATFMLLWDRNNQEVWDKIAGTIVVDDPAWQLRSY